MEKFINSFKSFNVSDQNEMILKFHSFNINDKRKIIDELIIIDNRNINQLNLYSTLSNIFIKEEFYISSLNKISNI